MLTITRLAMHDRGDGQWLMTGHSRRLPENQHPQWSWRMVAAVLRSSRWFFHQQQPGELTDWQEPWQLSGPASPHDPSGWPAQSHYLICLFYPQLILLRSDPGMRLLAIPSFYSFDRTRTKPRDSDNVREIKTDAGGRGYITFCHANTVISGQPHARQIWEHQTISTVLMQLKTSSDARWKMHKRELSVPCHTCEQLIAPWTY